MVAEFQWDKNVDALGTRGRQFESSDPPSVVSSSTAGNATMLHSRGPKKGWMAAYQAGENQSGSGSASPELFAGHLPGNPRPLPPRPPGPGLVAGHVRELLPVTPGPLPPTSRFSLPPRPPGPDHVPVNARELLPVTPGPRAATTRFNLLPRPPGAARVPGHSRGRLPVSPVPLPATPNFNPPPRPPVHPPVPASFSFNPSPEYLASLPYILQPGTFYKLPRRPRQPLTPTVDRDYLLTPDLIDIMQAHDKDVRKKNTAARKRKLAGLPELPELKVHGPAVTMRFFTLDFPDWLLCMLRCKQDKHIFYYYIIKDS